LEHYHVATRNSRHSPSPNPSRWVVRGCLGEILKPKERKSVRLLATVATQGTITRVGLTSLRAEHQYRYCCE